MSTNVNLALDTRYKRIDSQYPIVVRLSRDERTIGIPTEYYVPKKDWDDKKREVKTSYTGVTSVTRLNNQIQAKRKTARDIILELEACGTADALSLLEIKSRIENHTKSGSFFIFAEELAQDLREAQKFGTAKWYECTISVLKDFVNGADKHAHNGKSKGTKGVLYKGKDLKFREITYSFLTKFETRHYSDGNKANGLSMYMRAVRAIYNKAIKAGIANKDALPFGSYKIPSEQTRKLALDWHHLEKILKADLSPNDIAFNARNYFVATYMMYGMSFIDMAYLRKTDIVDGRIHYRRQKTSRLYDIKVTAALSEILSYYTGQNPSSPFVFPVIHRNNAEDQDRDMVYGRKKYNKHLKKLATGCSIPSELMCNMTSKVIRHSFASQARLAGVPVDIIKEMLGHSSIKTTEIYLNALPTYTLDDYNERVMAANELAVVVNVPPVKRRAAGVS